MVHFIQSGRLKMKESRIIAALGILGAFGLFVMTIRIMADKPKELRTAKDELEGFRNGDIIFQTSKSNQSKAIQLATHSKYSHMGIVYSMDGTLFVYEAVQPVKLTKLSDWIKRGENSHYVVKRLKQSEKVLTAENLRKMKDVGSRFKGKDYDLYFGWSDDKIYCSELVWKIYKEALGIEIGNLQELREFDLTHDIVKSKMKERYHDKIPLDEKVISPGAMFDSDKLLTVKEN